MATTYGQFCPVAMASEVLTERWTPLVVRELLCGSTRFNDLRRGVPLMSPALLSKRLKTLERVGVVDHVGGEYHLTAAGKELWPVIESMGVWGQRWARGDVIVKNYDASLLMWDIHRNVDVDALPEHRVVVHFHLKGSSDKKSHFWLVLESPTVASKRWVYRQYDHMVRTNTLVMPGMGAGVVRIKDTARALAMHRVRS